MATTPAAGEEAAVRVRELIAKGDRASAVEAAGLLRDPETRAAHELARVVDLGAPIGRAIQAHEATIRKHMAAGEVDELAGMLRTDPAAYAAYDVLSRSGRLPELPRGTAAALAKRRADTKAPPAKGEADPPGLEETKRLIMAMIDAKDTQGLSRLMRTKAGQEAYAAMVRDKAA